MVILNLKLTKQFKSILGDRNWTEWSTIQGVNCALNFKIGQVQITMPIWNNLKAQIITPWIVQHNVQLLINHTCIYTKILEFQVSFENFFEV